MSGKKERHCEPRKIYKKEKTPAPVVLDTSGPVFRSLSLLRLVSGGLLAVKSDGVIDEKTADEALSMLEIDKIGLDRTDKSMLKTMMEVFGGGPVGLDTLAATTGEDTNTIEDVYEPYLMQLGFIQRTPRGRCVTKLCYDYFHIPYTEEKNKQQSILDL